MAEGLRVGGMFSSVGTGGMLSALPCVSNSWWRLGLDNHPCVFPIYTKFICSHWAVLSQIQYVNMNNISFHSPPLLFFFFPSIKDKNSNAIQKHDQTQPFFPAPDPKDWWQDSARPQASCATGTSLLKSTCGNTSIWKLPLPPTLRCFCSGSYICSSNPLWAELRATLMPCVPSCDYGGTSADKAAQGPCSRIPVPQWKEGLANMALNSLSDTTVSCHRIIES